MHSKNVHILFSDFRATPPGTPNALLNQLSATNNTLPSALHTNSNYLFCSCLVPFPKVLEGVYLVFVWGLSAPGRLDWLVVAPCSPRAVVWHRREVPKQGAGMGSVGRREGRPGGVSHRRGSRIRPGVLCHCK